MRAVISVVGKDQVGILASVATICAQDGANIIDVNQTVMDDFFTMMMLVDTSELNIAFEDFQKNVENSHQDMKIRVMHEDIFNAMHEV